MEQERASKVAESGLPAPSGRADGPQQEVVVKLYSYVVQHDNGYAPNPYFGVCTLCRCKFRRSAAGRKNIVELAKRGEWVVGTGGASERSAGHGKLIYAMRVDEKLTREQYYKARRFAQKKPMLGGTYKQTRGDNERPRNNDERKQFALVSRHFYYFGAKAICIPRDLDIEKKGPGFRSRFDQAVILRCVEWLEKRLPGKHGEPCYQELPKGSRRCK